MAELSNDALRGSRRAGNPGAGERGILKRIGRVLKYAGIALALVLVTGGVAVFLIARGSLIPDKVNMSSAGTSGGDSSNMNMPGMEMGTPSANVTPISAFVVTGTNRPVRSFTLTTQPARIDLGNGKTVNTYTFNGTLPGPELRVQEGDLVVVTVTNKLPVSTSVHWHGIAVPNAEDGVAGLTQDAIKPGQSYTYSFVANDVGTYWYHSHQDTSVQLPLGLYGPLIVDPKVPPVHYDRDYTVVLHEWYNGGTCQQTCPETLMVNGRDDRITFAAKPGENVHLRIVNGGDDFHRPVLVGVPFKVIALDGHDLNEPALLNDKMLEIGDAQRYDVSFVMPSSGSVALIDTNPRALPADQHPVVLIGNGTPDPASFTYPANLPVFDFTTYGSPLSPTAAQDTITLNTHFTARYDMVLDNQLGFYNGEFTMKFVIDGTTYPNIPSIKVKLGDVIKIHMVNNGNIPHSMHLHGHVFTVLAHNGVPLSGSPVRQDTVIVRPGESVDVAFAANNPGLWMLHCHITAHDAHGMDMMVEYPDIFTPYSIGPGSGNNPF
jgi:FtsP/CotA-like multicopper oxidase with cupredoxin domain